MTTVCLAALRRPNPDIRRDRHRARRLHDPARRRTCCPPWSSACEDRLRRSAPTRTRTRSRARNNRLRHEAADHRGRGCLAVGNVASRTDSRPAGEGMGPYGGLSHARQGALLDMAALAGWPTRPFHDMLAALERGDWAAASTAALDSLWAKEVPGRAKAIAAILGNG